jgi:hypothetical protein
MVNQDHKTFSPLLYNLISITPYASGTVISELWNLTPCFSSENVDKGTIFHQTVVTHNDVLWINFSRTSSSNILILCYSGIFTPISGTLVCVS